MVDLILVNGSVMMMWLQWRTWLPIQIKFHFIFPGLCNSRVLGAGRPLFGCPFVEVLLVMERRSGHPGDVKVLGIFLPSRVFLSSSSRGFIPGEDAHFWDVLGIQGRFGVRNLCILGYFCPFLGRCLANVAVSNRKSSLRIYVCQYWNI